MVKNNGREQKCNWEHGSAKSMQRSVMGDGWKYSEGQKCNRRAQSYNLSRSTCQGPWKCKEGVGQGSVTGEKKGGHVNMRGTNVKQ